MVFTIRERDLAGRIGQLTTKSGKLETPALLPVINPSKLVVAPSEMAKMGFQAVITNAYILWKNYGEAIEKGATVHEILNFDGIVMTDSGAYQILRFKRIDFTPDLAIKVQEKLSSDIAVILDIPTPTHASREEAEYSVEETIKRAKESEELRTKEGILWVGPVQGARYADLVEKSAKAISKMRFDLYAIGSPTTAMERYEYEVLVDMIVTAKKHIPHTRPLHLFGAGHPTVMPIAVALGCDLFDSASYALFARDDRYMTPYGTRRLDSLDYLPCNCPVCSSKTAEELREMPKEEREKLLAKHNLYVLAEEIKKIKQAIKEGTLWEYVRMKCYAHPGALSAFKKMLKYKDYLEQEHPQTKAAYKGLFFMGKEDFHRPVVYRHHKKLLEEVSKSVKEKVVLVPEPDDKPYSRSRLVKKVLKLLGRRSSELSLLVYCFPYVAVPLELDETYPFSQYEKADLGHEANDSILELLTSFLRSSEAKEVYVVKSSKWSEAFYEKLVVDLPSKRVAVVDLPELAELANHLG